CDKLPLTHTVSTKYGISLAESKNHQIEIMSFGLRSGGNISVDIFFSNTFIFKEHRFVNWGLGS
ncbi:MAG: hypothetical protein WBB24_02695, partial [Maribacter sp.]